jgi:2',3'-cyclic-nucleotide 2'-phosphodiesterase (5'-nucleotidase family)
MSSRSSRRSRVLPVSLASLAWTLLWGLSAPAGAVPVSVVGTNDLHGRVERAAALAGHLKLLRSAREQAGGGVVLVDAGDMFQGTLESNLGEGQIVVDAYNALGFDAAAVGNHEFDFGPVGPAATAARPEEDPRGALKARAKQARFPFLAANTLDEATGQPVAWPNFRPSTMVTLGHGARAVKVGIVGVTTIDTPRTTIAGNVRGLRFAPLLEAVLREATRLRADGARVVVVTAHAGGKCDEAAIAPPFSDLSSCDPDAEIFRLAQGLPAGLVDVIVAGHTHQALAHVVHGIPIVEAWANGRGFSRVDLEVDEAGVRVLGVHAPRRVCGPKGNDDAPMAACAPEPYVPGVATLGDASSGAGSGAGPEVTGGSAVRVDVDHALLARLEPALAQARKQRARPLGVVVDDEIQRGYDKESALGNLFADLMRAAMPGVDVALMNGGGIRAHLPAGPLTYGAVFEMMPFDNRFATVTLTGAELRRVFERNLSSTKKGGLLSVSGLTLSTRCEQGAARVTLVRADGRPVTDDDKLIVATTDFVALGGDGGLGVVEDRIRLDEGEPVREHLARMLAARGGHVGSASTFDAAAPRMRTEGQAGGRCLPSSAPAPSPPAAPPASSPPRSPSDATSTTTAR